MSAVRRLTSAFILGIDSEAYEVLQMKDIVIDVGRQLDGFTFRLNPESRIKMREEFPDMSPASGVFISYENRQNFEKIGKAVWKHVAMLLTGLSDSQIDEFARFVFVSPADGKKIFDYNGFRGGCRHDSGFSG